MMLRRLCFPVLAVVLLAGGCATTRGAAEPDVTTSTEKNPVKLPGARIVAEPQGPDALEVYNADTLYVRGEELFEAGVWEEAAGYFDRVVTEFPDSPYVHSSRYARTQCYLNLEDGARALASADEYLAHLPEGRFEEARLNGRFKRGAALALLKRYQDVVDLFDEMLVEPLRPRDEIEALVDSGIGHFMLGDRPTAEYRFLKARRLYQSASQHERLTSTYFVAQASFYLAELARLEYADLKLHYASDEEVTAAGFDNLEAFLGDQLEQKCQRLLRAQYMFLRVIREQHTGWASAAGYKIGWMYEDLYNELMALDDPDGLTDEQRVMFRSALENKVAILLDKAIRVWQSTTDMAVRTGTENEWVAKTKESLGRVKSFVLARSKTGPAGEQS